MEEVGFSLFIPGLPIPQGSSTAFMHNGRPVITSANRKLKGWRTKVRTAVAMHTQRPPESPYWVVLRFCLPRPKHHYGSKGVKDSAPTSHTSKPDLDKLVRAVLDGVTDAKVWVDDSHVVRIVASKEYVDLDKIGVHITLRHAEHLGAY